MNYYEILEIHPKASKEVVKAAYKSLMQRYHPDKNPNNAEAARHAARIAQAYGVISDESQRAIYDLQLQEQLQEQLKTQFKEQAAKVYAKVPENYNFPLRKTAPNRPAVEKNNAWFAWLLIFVILLSGFLILFLKKEKPPETHLRAETESGASTLNPALNPALKNNPADSEPQTQTQAQTQAQSEVAFKTFQLFSSMKVNVKDANQQEHVLSISQLKIKVGSYEPEKFINDIERRKEAITRELADRLASASYEELANDEIIMIDEKPTDEKKNEQYLKKFILDALGNITGTDRSEKHPPTGLESPSHYGAVDIIWSRAPFSLK